MYTHTNKLHVYVLLILMENEFIKFIPTHVSHKQRVINEFEKIHEILVALSHVTRV